ncbi:MAG: hypothetical protein AB7U62_04100 [Pseudolabrys sp.]
MIRPFIMPVTVPASVTRANSISLRNVECTPPALAQMLGQWASPPVQDDARAAVAGVVAALHDRGGAS